MKIREGHGMQLGIVLFLILLPGISWAQNRVVVFTNGYTDCCAWDMNRVIEHVQKRGMRIHQTSWTHFTHGSRSRAIDLTGTRQFVREGMDFFNSLPEGTEVFLIGHSWGADSLLHLVGSYRRSRIKIRLLAVIDPVSSAGFRHELRQFTVGNHVEYFFNRWQENQPFPNDFQANGEIRCNAGRKCDQAEQSFHKNADGSTVRRTCGWHEFGCSGRRENPFDAHPGYVNKRAGHQGLPTDGWIEAELIRIIDQLSTTGATGTGSYESAVTALYRNVLGRAPEPGGLQHHVALMQRGASVEQLRAGIAGSQESRNNINGLYRRYLCRNAEPAGMEHHVNLLASGSQTLSQIDAGIRGSAEAQSVQRRGGCR